MLFDIVLWNSSFKLKKDESVENFDSLNSLRYNYQFDNYDGFGKLLNALKNNVWHRDMCLSHTLTHTQNPKLIKNWMTDKIQVDCKFFEKKTFYEFIVLNLNRR